MGSFFSRAPAERARTMDGDIIRLIGWRDCPLPLNVSSIHHHLTGSISLYHAACCKRRDEGWDLTEALVFLPVPALPHTSPHNLSSHVNEREHILLVRFPHSLLISPVHSYRHRCLEHVGRSDLLPHCLDLGIPVAWKAVWSTKACLIDMLTVGCMQVGTSSCPDLCCADVEFPQSRKSFLQPLHTSHLTPHTHHFPTIASSFVWRSLHSSPPSLAVNSYTLRRST